VDHRSLEDQGIHRETTRHRGPAVTAIERRGKQGHVVERWHERDKVLARLRRAAELGRIELETEKVYQSILDLSNDIVAARRERDASLGHAVPSTTPAKVQSLPKTLWQQSRTQQTTDKQIDAA
jgi:hypothetical protein